MTPHVYPGDYGLCGPEPRGSIINGVTEQRFVALESSTRSQVAWLFLTVVTLAWNAALRRKTCARTRPAREIARDDEALSKAPDTVAFVPTH